MWTARAAQPSDFDAWCRLYRGYCDFYQRETSPEHLALVWKWIHDDKTVDAIVAVPADGVGDAVGLAHLRPWVRPLRGVVCGYLDDLFVDPQARASGAVDVLFEAINTMALQRDWPVVRWTTADDNYRARGVYDRLATRTTWITYDMTASADFRYPGSD